MGSDRENRNMRITEKQLRQIIREEVKSLRVTDSRPTQKVVGDYVYEIAYDGPNDKVGHYAQLDDKGFPVAVGEYDPDGPAQYGEYLYPAPTTGLVPNIKSVPVGG